jgi:hypothetical protein
MEGRWDMRLLLGLLLLLKEGHLIELTLCVDLPIIERNLDL